MPVFRTRRRVRHSAQAMFDLVADVEKYPAFVPLCVALKVRKRAVDAQGAQVLTADMEIGYRAIREKFTSRVTLDAANMQILVEYIDGPFSHMENRWSFVAESLADPADAKTCTVEFFIDYAFKSRTFTLLMGGLFDTAFRKFAGAFEARADAIYGTGRA